MKRRAVRMRLALGVVAAVAGGLLWACAGDAGSPEPAMTPSLPASTVPAPHVGRRGAVVPAAAETTIVPGVTSAPSAVQRRGRSGGWVEDAGWAATSRFAGSAWSPLDAPVPLEPAQRDGVRIGASPGDSGGALWTGHPSAARMGGIVFRVYDMCVLEEAVDWYTGDGAYRLNTAQVVDIHEYMDELDCDGDGVRGPLKHGYVRGRYLAAGRDFDSRAEAEAYAERYGRQWPHRYSHTLPRGVEPLGLNLCSGERCSTGNWLAIEYASAAAPVDEVRVLGGSLAVRDGSLRGLVRNWSRSLWAYRVTVTVGDQSWHWPLSMQPGEAAPFEIDDWAGSGDPLDAEYTVTAQMSPDIDRSRMFGIGEFPDLLQDQFSRYLPQEIIDALPEDTEALTYFYAHFIGVGSHPSLSRLDPDRGEGEWFFELAPPEFEPRVLSARIDSDGRVMDVRQITPTHSHGYRSDGTIDLTPQVASRIPGPHGGTWFDIIGTPTRIWVGGADTGPAVQ